MKTQVLNGVNVAPNSTHGHFVKSATVVNVGQASDEAFTCRAEAGTDMEVVTENHGTLTISEEYAECYTQEEISHTGEWVKAQD